MVLLTVFIRLTCRIEAPRSSAKSIAMELLMDPMLTDIKGIL